MNRAGRRGVTVAELRGTQEPRVSLRFCTFSCLVNESMKKVLIIGGGIAGCSLAWQLEKKEVSVKVLDKNQNHSSFVAAGMINPVVFRRVNLSWRVNEMLPYARSFYTEIEEEAQRPFCTPLRIRRFFASEQEKKYWITKQEEEAYKPYLTPFEEKPSPPNSRGKTGSALVKNGFRVNASAFMHFMHQYLKEKKIMEYSFFNPEDFDPIQRRYRGEKYDVVVFACGSENASIPFFEDARIEHTKGQLITIDSDEIGEKECWNQKGWILPLGDKKFRVGATMERRNDDLCTTQEGLNELKGVIENLTSASYGVCEHEAGIRPTVPDRRPVMGEHPVFNGLYIFNGLGTKGYLLAPLLSYEMARHILYREKLNPECCISRIYKNKDLNK